MKNLKSTGHADNRRLAGASNFCRHNASLATSCIACVLESKSRQPVWKVIPELLRAGRYARRGEGPECTIERDGSRYEVRMVRSQDEATVQEIQDMMEEAFGEEEVDPIEVLKAGLDGKLLDGSPDAARYRLFVARDGTGRVQSVYAGGLIEMVAPALSDEAVFMGAYGVTRRESRRQGIVRELYVSSMMQAAADADTMGRRFSVVVGETTAGSERAWNAVGRRRVYVETTPNSYSELRYVQPALDFDPGTGLPAKGAGEVSEHIMVHFLEGQPDKPRLSAAVESIYLWCNTWPDSLFTNEAAYRTHLDYVAKLHREFDRFMQARGPLTLLSAQQREQLQDAGAVIDDYLEADRREF